MSVLSGVSDFFGLEIGATALRLVELKGTGATKVLAKYAYMPLEGNIALSDSKADQQKLMQVLAQLVEQAKIGTKNVAVNIPSSKVFSTVADVERLAQADLAKAIHYQADALIPTPLTESKIDWALLGDSPADKNKVEILLSSVSNKFIEERLDLLESIGLNVIAFEPDYLALVRALVPEGAQGAQMVIDIGQKSTDLVMLLDGTPRLLRSIPTGVEAIFRAAAQNLSIDDKQAEQFVLRFGLSRDKLEGQVVQAITGSVDTLVSEFDKSIKFFATRYAGTKLSKIIVSGGAAVIPEFPLYLANKFGVDIEIGNSWRGVSYSSDRQNELSAVSNQFAVAVGLAERQE
jgi:type IV pilus assembly protein PilM